MILKSRIKRRKKQYFPSFFHNSLATLPDRFGTPKPILGNFFTIYKCLYFFLTSLCLTLVALVQLTGLSVFLSALYSQKTSLVLVVLRKWTQAWAEGWTFRQSPTFFPLFFFVSPLCFAFSPGGELIASLLGLCIVSK